MTTRVTAFLGSLAAELERALRLAAGLLVLGFAIVAGLYSKADCEENCRVDHAKCGRSICATTKNNYGYFSGVVRPAFKLSKFRIAFRTSA